MTDLLVSIDVACNVKRR